VTRRHRHLAGAAIGRILLSLSAAPPRTPPRGALQRRLRGQGDAANARTCSCAGESTSRPAWCWTRSRLLDPLPEPVQVLESIPGPSSTCRTTPARSSTYDITDYGFRRRGPADPRGDDCKGGSVRVGSDDAAEPQRRGVLCVPEPSGLAYRLQNPEENSRRSPSRATTWSCGRSARSAGTKHHRVPLRDSGRITARLGATGDLSPATSSPRTRAGRSQGRASYSTNHYHRRVLARRFQHRRRRQGEIEQYDTKRAGAGPGSRSSRPRRRTSRGGRFTKVNRRWWAGGELDQPEQDEHLRSYELDTGANDPYEAHRRRRRTSPSPSSTPVSSSRTGNGRPRVRQPQDDPRLHPRQGDDDRPDHVGPGRLPPHPPDRTRARCPCTGRAST